MSARLGLVVLCAGASTRLGQPKALAQLGPGPHERALTLLLRAGRALGDPHPLVVTGAEHERLLPLLDTSVESVRNVNWHAGRTGSVACAARARPDTDLCLAPIDVPRVSAEVFAALASAWRAAGAPAEGWLAPRVTTPEGVRHGHPVVVGRALLARLKDFPPDRPLLALRALARPLLAIHVRDRAVLDDLDTPADLARLRARETRPGETTEPGEEP